ncbi:MAG TPA: hypothetical protein VMT89_02590, partial [Candidatus Acidoferrales bacterium]|nr:hypothetical protein [Candidatus Acidoferrales bacterium]
KVKKGKSERYLKDETMLEDYLIELGTENLVLKAASGGEELTGIPLKNVVKKVRRLERLLDLSERLHKNRHVVATLIRDARMVPSVLSDRATLEQLAADLKARLAVTNPELQPLQIELVDDPEHACFKLHVRTRTNGSSRLTVVDTPFCLTPEFEELRREASALRSVGEAPYTVSEGDKQSTMQTLRSAVDYILEQARKGLDIQRYKGLGEMNPEQLWQTTMNPESRTLLQVKIEDAYEADEIFSTLMGDEVEPRRKFIEENALNVRNLDI